MNNKKMSIGIGSLSVITLFIVLCLTIFSALVVLSAYQDNKLTEKTIESINNFYRADGIANEKRMEIDQLRAHTLEELKKGLEEVEGITCQADEAGQVIVGYQENVSEQQVLDVQWQAELGDNGSIQYTTLNWALVPVIGDYEIDEPSFEDVIIK